MYSSIPRSLWAAGLFGFCRRYLETFSKDSWYLPALNNVRAARRESAESWARTGHSNRANAGATLYMKPKIPPRGKAWAPQSAPSPSEIELRGDLSVSRAVALAIHYPEVRVVDIRCRGIEDDAVERIEHLIAEFKIHGRLSNEELLLHRLRPILERPFVANGEPLLCRPYPESAIEAAVRASSGVLRLPRRSEGHHRSSEAR